MSFLRIFEAKALASALTDAGHSVSERTVQRWKAGETNPKPQDLHAIRLLIDASFQAHEETAPPEWARRLSVRLRAHSAKLAVSPDDLALAAIEEAAEWVVGEGGAGRPRQQGGGGSRALEQ